MPALQATHGLAQDQKRAMSQARSTQDDMNHGKTILATQDSGGEAKYVIYVYNLLNRPHTVSQPPLFPAFQIPACSPGEKFAYTVLPAFVKLAFIKPGSTELYYETQDGRKAATSLLNPASFPGTRWENQQGDWNSGPENDQTGNNLNAYGVFWSLTRPDETERLAQEMAIFRERAGRTMDELIRQAELFAAANDLKSISPLMHFAMDYKNKQAPWHMASHHMVACPLCGEPVREGIAYHRNSFGDKCIIDRERCIASGILKLRVTEEVNNEDEDDAVPVDAAPAPKAKSKTKRSKAPVAD